MINTPWRSAVYGAPTTRAWVGRSLELPWPIPTKAWCTTSRALHTVPARHSARSCANSRPSSIPLKRFPPPIDRLQCECESESEREREREREGGGGATAISHISTPIARHMSTFVHIFAYRTKLQPWQLRFAGRTP